MIILKMFSRRWLLTTLLVLIGSAVCVRLGIWQLDRLDQRRAFNAHYEAMTALPPLQINGQTAEDLPNQEYRAVIAQGVYDFEAQVAIRNQYFRGQLGYHLLTPLVFEDGAAILVDRGWIPADDNDTPAAWRKYDQPGRVDVSGILRPGRAVDDFGRDLNPALAPGQTRLNFWALVDISRIQAQIPYPLLQAYIQQNVDPADETPPVPYQPSVEITEGSHFGYAVQWFTFATILFFGYPFFLKSREPMNVEDRA